MRSLHLPPCGGASRAGHARSRAERLRARVMHGALRVPSLALDCRAGSSRSPGSLYLRALYARAEPSCSAAFTCMRPAELCALGLRLTIAGALDATSRRRSSMACLQGVQVVRLSLRCLVAPGSWCRQREDQIVAGVVPESRRRAQTPRGQ